MNRKDSQRGRGQKAFSYQLSAVSSETRLRKSMLRSRTLNKEQGSKNIERYIIVFYFTLHFLIQKSLFVIHDSRRLRSRTRTRSRLRTRSRTLNKEQGSNNIERYFIILTSNFTSSFVIPCSLGTCPASAG